MNKSVLELTGIQSVLQDWVMNLPLRYQGTLITNIRSCDLAPKNPACINELNGCSTGEETPERSLTAFLRGCIMVHADDREMSYAGSFIRDTPPDPKSWKPSQFGHYPLHWYTHLMHGFEIIGYCHPDLTKQKAGGEIYLRLVHALHLSPESKSEMHNRLVEDRIASGNVTS